jgi:hypothetical protein
MAERRAECQIANLIFDHKKSEIALVYLRESGVPHIVGKLSTRVTTLY